MTPKKMNLLEVLLYVTVVGLVTLLQIIISIMMSFFEKLLNPCTWGFHKYVEQRNYDYSCSQCKKYWGMRIDENGDLESYCNKQ